jgi:hypothetical protein
MAGGIIKSVLESAIATGDFGASRVFARQQSSCGDRLGTQTADTHQGQLHGRTE